MENHVSANEDFG